MPVLFQDFNSKHCSLCGEISKLTGEHKIKRSALKNEFGETPLYIGQGNKSTRFKIVQSTKSKHFKFETSICESCNTRKTQPADLEFDSFNKTARMILNSGGDPATVFDLPQYREGTEAYLNVFRYFAKLLCCHLSEVKAPLLLRLSKFAIHSTNENCVFLAIQKDWFHEKINEFLGETQSASHGGLTVYGNKSSKTAERFQSTLSIGPLQYIFYINLSAEERSELNALHPRFSKFCHRSITLAIQNQKLTD